MKAIKAVMKGDEKILHEILVLAATLTKMFKDKMLAGPDQEGEPGQ